MMCTEIPIWSSKAYWKSRSDHSKRNDWHRKLQAFEQYSTTTVTLRMWKSWRFNCQDLDLRTFDRNTIIEFRIGNFESMVLLHITDAGIKRPRFHSSKSLSLLNTASQRPVAFYANHFSRMVRPLISISLFELHMVFRVHMHGVVILGDPKVEIGRN